MHQKINLTVRQINALRKLKAVTKQHEVELPLRMAIVDVLTSFEDDVYL